MHLSAKQLACLAALVCCLLSALPSQAEPLPLWASKKGVAKLNAQRSNDTYKFYYIEPFYLDDQQMRQQGIYALVDLLADEYGLDARKGSVDTVACRVTFGSDTWFKYKVVDRKNMFESDVRQYWGWTMYQLLAVSAKNTEPLYDDYEVVEQGGTRSLVQSLIPGVSQWKKQQKEKAVVIWVSEAALVAGAVYMFGRNSDYKDRGWRNKANSWREMACLSSTLAVGMYIYNLVDAYHSRGGRTVKVKGRDVSTALVPFVTDNGGGVSLALRF